MRADKKVIFLYLSLVLFLAASVSGCTNPSSPQAQIFAQIDQGSHIYNRDCATELCHGLQGEGLRSDKSYRVWPLVGAEFEARNPNAQVIFDVARSGSEPNLRALSDEEIYAAIAYELDQNGVRLTVTLNDENAASIASGLTSPPAAWGTLYPPPGNARLLPPPPVPVELPKGAADSLRLRVDQLVKAGVIGQSVAQQGGYFVILVLALQNRGDAEIIVDPQFLRLIDTIDQVHPPAKANLAYPMERIHPQAIQPGYSAAGYEIFAIPPGADYDRLVYNDPGEPSLVIDLR